MLAELDGAVSMLRYGAFCLIPYFPCTTLGVPITKIVDSKVLDMMSDDEDAKNKVDTHGGVGRVSLALNSGIIIEFHSFHLIPS